MTDHPAQTRPAPTDSARDWALCVATYNRGAVLRDCVRHALASTLPPSEIVIVDASADWQQNRDAIAAEIAATNQPCPLHYLPARRKSASDQRNQAIARASADILFLIDDDSMLHPQTAARILSHYAANPHLVAISCCNTPLDDPADAQIKATSAAGRLATAGRARPAPVQRVIDFALRHLLMIPAEQRFVTYDRPDQRWQGDTRLPPAMGRTEFIVGFGLTVRRAIALCEPFDDGLVGSSIAEDLDASYRYGRHGVLGFAPDAPIHHLEAAAGRDKRRVNTALALLNIAYFTRRNSTRQARDLARYGLWHLRMTLAELPKDLAGGRWRLPQVRGALLAGTRIPALLRQPRAGLPHWYRDEQTRIMTGTSPGHDRGNRNANAPDPGANG